MILSFLGGTHWYAGITSEIRAPIRKILVGIISSLAGITSLLIGGVIGALITTSGLLLLGGIEKYMPLSEQDGIEWYLFVLLFTCIYLSVLFIYLSRVNNLRVRQ